MFGNLGICGLEGCPDRFRPLSSGSWPNRLVHAGESQAGRKKTGKAKMVVMNILTYEEQTETMAFLKMINMGKKEIAEGKFQAVENFFTEIDSTSQTCILRSRLPFFSSKRDNTGNIQVDLVAEHSYEPTVFFGFGPY